MRILHAAMIAATVAGLSSEASSQLSTRKGLTLEAARIAIEGAVAYAESVSAPGGAIAVVDEGGNLVAVERLDGTFPASSQISIGKARTSVMFRKETAFFENLIKSGRTPMIALEDFTPLQGGVPLIVDGQVVGGIGVSGAASAQQDEELAMAGVRALQRGALARRDVQFLNGERVAASFVRGAPLLENARYKIHASHRDKPGMGEVHERDTDIIYVLKGTATLVTGGSLVKPQPTGPGEIRGESIDNGVARPLKPGDVIVVPRNTPHWFREVDGPFDYYVVKVTE